jgi:hypothetical protein
MLSKLASMRAELVKLADLLPGGRADGATDKGFDKKQEAMGHKVEREHTNSPDIAAEITRDHLSEIPDYYTRLKKMEEGAEKGAMAVNKPYLLDQVDKPKVRELGAMPPNPAFKMKTGALLSSSLQRVALGTGLGVAGGAAAGAAAGGEGHRVRGALLGGLGGGAMGAGAGWAAPRYMAGRKGGLGRMETVQSLGQDARAQLGSKLEQTGERMRRGAVHEQRMPTADTMRTARLPARPVNMAASSPAHALAADLTTGAQTPMAKAASAKLAWTESEYSGGTSIGAGNIDYRSYIPPFKNPPVKTAGPPSEKDAKITKMAAMRDEIMKLNAVSTIAGHAAQARAVGQPKTTAPPGPSIGDIAKPVGYGQKIPGATKTI